MTFDEWWDKHRAGCEFSSVTSKCVARFWEQESWNAALKFAQQPQTEICSKDICEYCVGCGEMSSCVDHSKFNGRKLSVVWRTL